MPLRTSAVRAASNEKLPSNIKADTPISSKAATYDG
jgi:hypothetical protein